MAGFIETAAFILMCGTIVLLHRFGRQYPQGNPALLWAIPAIGAAFVMLKWGVA